MATSQDFVSWVCSDEIEPRFLKYLFLAEGSGLLRFAAGAVHSTIYFPEVKAFHIAVPSVEMQRRIADTLDQVLGILVATQDRAEDNLQNSHALFESYLESVFSDPKRDWRLAVLGEVCERVTVGHVGTTSPHYRDQGITFLRTQNVGESGLVLDDVKHITPEFHAALRKSEVHANDVLVSRVISSAVRCALVPENIGPANCANVVLVRPGPDLLPSYLVHYIRSRQAQRHLLDRKVGSAQLVVNTTVMKNWPIPLPSRDEQRRIVARLDELSDESRRLAALYSQKVEAVRALKESLLHRAFLGELGAITT